MKIISRLYRFLGGIQFAIFLITTSALFVIAGTFLESYTSSHRYAARFTYGNPIFALLLWGFFINILFSTLRRWPFKSKHIPFIITHIGLLMLFGGAIIKNYVGTQGNMEIMEGGGSHEILLPDTLSVLIQKRDGSISYHDPKSKFFLIKEYVPHAKETKEAWIDNGFAKIWGLKPFPVSTESESGKLHAGSKAVLTPELTWNLIALTSKEGSVIAKRAYLQDLDLIVRDPIDGTVVYQGPLEKALQTPIEWKRGFITVSLNFSEENLELEYHSSNHLLPQKSRIELSGEDSLVNLNTTLPHLGAPVVAELKREPTLVLIKEDDILSLYSFDPWGRINRQSYNASAPESLIMYDHGFAGYTTKATFHYGESLESMKDFRKEQLKAALATANESDVTLVPPLQMLREACLKQNIDFLPCLIELMEKSKDSPNWILTNETPLSEQLQRAISSLNWAEGRKGCQWICSLGQELELKVKNGSTFLEALTSIGWPLTNRFETEQGNDFDTSMRILAQQILEAESLIPPQPTNLHSDTSLLSAYFRVYGIHLDHFPIDSMPLKEFTLESPVTFRQEPLTPLLKLEDNQPKVAIEINNAGKKELINLLFDPSGSGLKKGSEDGHFLFRFQPVIKEIPYHIRLHQARQINYPGMNQPYSYESDLTITDRRNGSVEDKTISMNQVHETVDGFRFYMANIASTEAGVRKIQIVINHDPAKYWLTYPGAIFLSLGILLLFWFSGRDKTR